MELLFEGCENAEIAKELGMALRTVKAHFNRLLCASGLWAESSASNWRRCSIERSANAWQKPIVRTPGAARSRRTIIRLVHEGLKNKEIGVLMGTTENMVKNYLRVIYDKLGMWNRVELALWYEKRRCEVCPLRALSSQPPGISLKPC